MARVFKMAQSGAIPGYSIIDHEILRDRDASQPVLLWQWFAEEDLGVAHGVVAYLGDP